MMFVLEEKKFKDLLIDNPVRALIWGIKLQVGEFQTGWRQAFEFSSTAAIIRGEK